MDLSNSISTAQGITVNGIPEYGTAGDDIIHTLLRGRPPVVTAAYLPTLLLCTTVPDDP